MDAWGTQAMISVDHALIAHHLGGEKEWQRLLGRDYEAGMSGNGGFFFRSGRHFFLVRHGMVWQFTDLEDGRWRLVQWLDGDEAWSTEILTGALAQLWEIAEEMEVPG